MIQPKLIKKGDTIGIVSPAGKIDQKYVLDSKKFLESLGYRVTLSRQVFAEHYQFAGKDQERIFAFQEMLDDDTIDAILCSRGGYGSVRIIEKLDFTEYMKSPKWIVGYSDITTFHSHIAENLNSLSIHGIMPKNYKDTILSKDSFRELFAVMEGNHPEYFVKAHAKNSMGSASGKLIGGNLAIVQNLRGTPYDFNPEGKILFLEDVGEYLYNIDRMMMNLKISGILEKINGLIIGQFTDSQDNTDPFGLNSHEIISEKIEEYNYPVCFGMDAGHELPNHPLIMGANVHLEVDEKGAKIVF